MCRVIGPYDFRPLEVHGEHGHILPVEVVVADVHRWDARVSDAPRHAISLRPRLYEITPYGGDVEVLAS